MSNTNDSKVLYDENKTNPNDINQTYQTTNTDGSILDEYRVSDANTNRYANTPNTTTESKDSATGSGLTAAENTQYSWDTKASERANITYQADVLEAKQNMLENRQSLETQGQQYQEQLDMQKYSQNQSNEKAGWTGGYILDTERQMSYLKQTIQSQMYGQMELQKYGYNTSLAAARLAYDTNKYDLALEYYNTALSRAVSEAEITGYYVSPETSEMLDQYSMASRTLNDETATEEEKLRADKILASVYEWFEANGISKQGVETYSHLVEERTHKMSLDQLYEYQNDAKNQISTDTFVKLDDNGNKIYGETGVETIDFSKMDATAIKEYITNPDGTINEAKRDQYYSRLDSLSYEMENNFATWCKSQGYTDEEGNTNITDYKEAFAEYIQDTDLADKLNKELSRFSEKDKDFIENLAESWDCDIELPDGTELTLKLVKSGTSTSGEKYTDENGNEIEKTSTVNSNITKIKLPDGSTIEAAYMKPQKSVDNVVKLLKTNNYKEIFDTISNLEIDDYKDVDGLIAKILGLTGTGVGSVLGGIAGTSIAVWGTAATSAATAGMIAGASAATAGIGAIMALGVDTLVTWTKDLFTSGDWEKKREGLEMVTNGLMASIGKDNLKLLEDAYNEYNNMDAYTKSGLSESKRQMYEDASKFYKNYSGILNAIEYASHYDSNLFDSDPFEYTGDMFKRIGDRWDDGYQFGDLTGTVIDTGKAVITAAEEFALCVVGKGWLW